MLTPTTVNEVGVTPITLLIEGNVCPDLLYLTKSFAVTIPTKLLPALVMLAKPLGKVALDDAEPTVPLPKVRTFLGIISAVKVLTPTLPYNDPMSDIS